MEPATVTVITNIAGLSISAVNKKILAAKLTGINSKLNELLKKSDQLIFREILSAFDALNDAISTNNEQTRKIRLDFAEKTLLNNTNLDISLDTAGFSNSYLVALVNYGLAFVCSLREDQLIASRHLIKMFEVSPRTARKELAPEIYEKLFKQKCEEILAQENYEESSNPKCEQNNILAQPPGWLKVTVTVGIMGIIGPAVLASKMWGEETVTRETKIDDCCKKIARDMLYGES